MLDSWSRDSIRKRTNSLAASGPMVQAISLHIVCPHVSCDSLMTDMFLQIPLPLTIGCCVI